MNIPLKYNQGFINYYRLHRRAWSDAEKYGVTVTPVPIPDPAAPHWRVIGVHHLTGAENHGQHNVFVDVLDEQGQRLDLTRILIFQDNGVGRGFMVIDKPGNEPGSNTQMHFNDTLTVKVDREGLPSEQVRGLHTRHDDEGAGTTRGHHSFYIVWQRAQGEPVKPPVVEPKPPTTPPVPPPPDPRPQPGFSLTEAEKRILRQALGVLLDKLGE